ncbi:SAM-dependent methyltransferase [Streptomyces avermitilis]|uniref:SAM-dependent methyltransferase n=1 Tax=Streptomyces avermitilis TaxID=33903 RepID=UPI0033B2029C
MTDHTTAPGAQPEFDTSVPHSARIWNCWLGGKDNYAVDEAAGDAYSAVYPGIVDEARSVVRRLLDGLPSGSYLSVNDGSRGTDPDYERAQDGYNETGAVPYFLRPVAQIEAFFEGLELVEPGVVSVPLWRPEESGGPAPAPIGQHGGLARKP